MMSKSLLLTISALLALLAPPAATAQTRDTETFDHSLLDRVLKTHVNHTGLVDYEALQSDPGDLADYLQQLAGVSEDRAAGWSRPEQVAFWINAYNALTLQAIIDHYPMDEGFLGGLFSSGQSIRQIDGVWDELSWPVAGDRRTLDEIEHEILRARFDEPRIHFALVCAAMSCPRLRREAYTGARLDRQLTEQALQFLNDPGKGMRIEQNRNRVTVSSVFAWFEEDFGCRGEALQIGARLNDRQRAIACYIAGLLLPSDPRREYLLNGNYSLRIMDYDWSLNQQ